MMTRDDAERIADTAVAIRPDWIRASIITLLHEFRTRNVRDVHMAMVWIAYDPQTRTPARLRESGPWWQLRDQRDTAPTLPSFRERWANQEPTTPASPEFVAECRRRMGHRTAETFTDGR